eukprot:TRINITY_DN33932_c0_g1_i1.p1 TRINITY_DN33932_c0_g1~~TRINITY_DN33932_c0_g1_i1.p1  ORF type:complete len:169 (-),score=23.89 TRINITY_DN33932_c0_g1_i1:87-593(-)
MTREGERARFESYDQVRYHGTGERQLQWLGTGHGSIIFDKNSEDNSMSCLSLSKEVDAVDASEKSVANDDLVFLNISVHEHVKGCLLFRPEKEEKQCCKLSVTLSEKSSSLTIDFDSNGHKVSLSKGDPQIFWFYFKPSELQLDVRSDDKVKLFHDKECGEGNTTYEW